MFWHEFVENFIKNLTSFLEYDIL